MKIDLISFPLTWSDQPLNWYGTVVSDFRPCVLIPSGNPITVEDANAHLTGSNFDLLGELKQKTLPDGTLNEQRTYDANGNLKTVVRFNGKTTTYAYDALNRLLSRTPDSTTGETPVSFTYTRLTAASAIFSHVQSSIENIRIKSFFRGSLDYSFMVKRPLVIAVLGILETFGLVCPRYESLGHGGPPSFPGMRTEPSASMNKDFRGPVQRGPTIDFQNEWKNSKAAFKLKNSVSPQRYSIETMMGGVAVFDYNNDGLLDIFFTNGASIPSLEKTGKAYWNRLFRNNGDETFTDVTEAAGVAGVGYSMGVAAGDYDNDGYVDLYVAGVNANQLLHNNRDGMFTDVTANALVDGKSHGGKEWAVTAGWFDYDQDGRLDLLVMNYLKYDIGNAVLCRVGEYPAYCSPDGFQGTANILYHNNGDGTFTDVSESSHIAQYVGKAMGVAFGDYDQDGFPDVFVSNDTFQNFLFHNNRDGTFTDVALEAGVAYTGNGKTVAGMGAEFRDLDNDGRPDIYHTAMFGNTFPLYRNAGHGIFEDVTAPSEVAAMTARMTAWGTGAYDFDNDGRKDLFSAGAEILDNAEQVVHRPFALPDLVMRNMGNMRFENATDARSADLVAAHRGAAFGDFNNDGKIDVVVAVLNGPPELLINRTQNGNHWIEFRLVGVKSNRDGLGTTIKLTTAAGTQYNEATTAVGYNSSSDKRVHFGLGSERVVNEIELNWPSGTKQMLTNVKADQVLTVTDQGALTGVAGKSRSANAASPY